MTAEGAKRVSPARTVPVALTIAGSDSGGGAGIQADLKTFASLGVFGTSAITCLTAQNPDRVDGVEEVSPAMVARQIRTVCAGFPVAAAKTGMLFSAPIIRAVAREADRCGFRRLVVDPVMISTSGARLLRDDAVAALCRELLPLATVITPNLPEAEALLGERIVSIEDMKAAAEALTRRFGCASVVKGGHCEGSRVHDLLFDGRRMTVLTSPRLKVRETHGTGCTFSAALAANLAAGRGLADAFREAKGYVAAALRNATRAGRHSPLGWRRPDRD
jgi:hydroxymethylpyrimidine/phosphomethylpyrimidine kinase